MLKKYLATLIEIKAKSQKSFKFSNSFKVLKTSIAFQTTAWDVNGHNIGFC